MVAARRDAVGGLERLGDFVARQAFGRKTLACIVVAVGPGLGRIVVDDQDLVGQEQHEVALARLALELVVDRVELEGEVVAEGAVKAEIGVFRGLEQGGDGAQHGEDRRNAAALLLGEDTAGFGDVEADQFLRRLGDGDIGKAAQRLADDRQQHLATAVQRLDAHGAAARRDDQRRIDDGRVPARVAAGIFVVRGKHRAPARIQAIDIAVDRALIRPVVALAGDGDATRRHEAFSAVFQNLHRHCRLHQRLGYVSFLGQRTREWLEKTNGRPDFPLRPPSIFTRTRSNRPLSAGPPPNGLGRTHVHAKSHSGD